MQTQTSTDAAGGSRMDPESSNVSAMTAAPTVSVIIAAFNAERHIGAALAAALGQTGVAIEAVVADDASTDGTAAVVAGLGDPRVRLVRLERNSGPGAARNAAMAAAKGDWFAVLDADDSMAPGRIAALLEAALCGDADFVADNLWVERDDKRTLFIDEALDGGGSERLDFRGLCRQQPPVRRSRLWLPQAGCSANGVHCARTRWPTSLACASEKTSRSSPRCWRRAPSTCAAARRTTSMRRARAPRRTG